MLERLNRENLQRIVENDEPQKFVRAGKKRVYVSDMHTNHSDIYEVMQQRGKRPQNARDAGVMMTGRGNDAVLRGSSMTLGIGENVVERKKSIKTVQRIAGKDIKVRGSH